MSMDLFYALFILETLFHESRNLKMLRTGSLTLQTLDAVRYLALTGSSDEIFPSGTEFR